MLNNSEYCPRSSISSSTEYITTISSYSADSSTETLTIDGGCVKCSKQDQIVSRSHTVCLCTLQYKFHDTVDRFVTPIPRSMILENPGQLYNYINRCRRWIKVCNPKNLPSRMQFSLTTYNILAQSLLLNHLYLYQNNSHSDLNWSERCERLKKELLELNSDIFCLQEVQMANFQTTILPALKENGYEAVFKQKTGNGLDGCSILFKKNKFQLQDRVDIEFNRRDISHLLDKNQVALIVKLRPIGTDKITDTNLIVANTHLIFNPRRGDIKLAQLRLLLAELQRFAQKEKFSPDAKINPFDSNYFPIILCGDMNSEPNSPLINFIQNGKINLHGLKSGDISGQKEGFDSGKIILKKDLNMKNIDINSCFKNNKSNDIDDVDDGDHDECINDMEIKQVFDFKSAYQKVDDFDRQLFSTSTYNDCGLVDHIFYTYNHRKLRLYAFKQLLNRRNLNTIGNIPNSILGSDHIALSAKFFML